VIVPAGVKIRRDFSEKLRKRLYHSIEDDDWMLINDKQEITSTMDSGQMSDGAIMAAWYRFAATQPGYCESYLKLHRVRRFLTREQQQQMFGATDEQFLRLVGMPLPLDSAADFDGLVRRIALHCGIRSFYITAVVLAFREACQVVTSASFSGAGESEEE
jgi:hypothetical protein